MLAAAGWPRDDADAALANAQLALGRERSTAVPIEGAGVAAFADGEIAGAGRAAEREICGATDGDGTVAIATTDLRVRGVGADAEGPNRTARISADRRRAVEADDKVLFSVGAVGIATRDANALAAIAADKPIRKRIRSRVPNERRIDMGQVEIQIRSGIGAVEIEVGRVGADPHTLSVFQELDDLHPTIAAVGLPLGVVEHLVDVDASVVRVVPVTETVASEMAIVGHFEVAVDFHKLVPHIDAVVALDGKFICSGVPTCVAGANEGVRQKHGCIISVLRLARD